MWHLAREHIKESEVDQSVDAFLDAIEMKDVQSKIEEMMRPRFLHLRKRAISPEELESRDDVSRRLHLIKHIFPILQIEDKNSENIPTWYIVIYKKETRPKVMSDVKEYLKELQNK